MRRPLFSLQCCRYHQPRLWLGLLLSTLCQFTQNIATLPNESLSYLSPAPDNICNNIWQEICIPLNQSLVVLPGQLTIPEMDQQEFSYNLGADRIRSGGLRRRRTMSSSRAEGIVTAELRARRQQPDRPIHRPTDSLLSWTKQVSFNQVSESKCLIHRGQWTRGAW